MQNNTLNSLDNAKGLDVAMTMYMLIEQSNNYSKSSEILWQYYRDMLGVADNPVKTDFESFKSNVKIIKKAPKQWQYKRS